MSSDKNDPCDVFDRRSREYAVCVGIANLSFEKRVAYLHHWAQKGRIATDAIPSLISRVASARMARQATHKLPPQISSTVVGGVGSELKALLKELGFEASASCSCNAVASEMDQIGPHVCAQQRTKYIKALRAAYNATQWAKIFQGIALAISKGYLFLAGLNPIERLFDEAVRRASVTVVIPTYNCAEYLETCLKSLHAQAFLPAQIVVVDDGSTDGTQDILKAHPEVVVITHPTNLGANQARNTGLRECKTGWVVFADADAEYYPEFLKELIQQGSPDTDLVYCRLDRQREATNTTSVIASGEWSPSKIWWGNYISMCSLIRCRALTSLPTSKVHLDGLDDWALWLQLAEQRINAAFVPRTLFMAWERVNGKTNAVRSNVVARFKEVAHYRRMYPSLIGFEGVIAVVIPYYNGAHLLRKCLEHLRDFSGLPLKVIVVDNASREAVPVVQGITPYVIRNDCNLGFTAAVNQGLECARGHHTLVLNSDCFIGPNCIERMWHYLASPNERIASTGPKTCDGGHQSLTPRHKELVEAVEGYTRVGLNHSAQPQQMLAFFCTLLHRDAISELGLLDTREVFSSGLGADDEWCIRARLAGWKHLLVNDAFASHIGRASFDLNDVDRDALQEPAIAEVMEILRDARLKLPVV